MIASSSDPVACSQHGTATATAEVPASCCCSGGSAACAADAGAGAARGRAAPGGAAQRGSALPQRCIACGRGAAPSCSGRAPAPASAVALGASDASCTPAGAESSGTGAHAATAPRARTSTMLMRRAPLMRWFSVRHSRRTCTATCSAMPSRLNSMPAGGGRGPAPLGAPLRWRRACARTRRASERGFGAAVAAPDARELAVRPSQAGQAGPGRFRPRAGKTGAWLLRAGALGGRFGD
jgi:hypothetical protein